MTRYAVTWRPRSDNLGDDLLTLAASRLLPRVDMALDADRLDEPLSDLEPDDRVVTLLCGKVLAQPIHWPPERHIAPVMVGAHFSREDVWGIPMTALDGAGLAYLRALAPLGCRDEVSMALMEEMHLPCRLTACLTLTLDGEHAPGAERKGIICCDVPEDVLHALENALGIIDGRGEADDVQGDALHGIVERDHGVDHFQRLADLHMSGPLGRAQAGEGVAHGGGGDVGRDGDDLAAVAEQQIALGGIRAHEGHLAIAQALGTHAELETPYHVLGLHGTRGQDEELVSGLCENLLKRKAHGLRLQLGIAGYCAIDEGFDTASRCEENK